FPSRRRITAGDAELDAFEARRGFKLPGSYRNFAREFGRCELATDMGVWKIAVPALPADSDSLDLDWLNESMAGVVAIDAEGCPGQEPGDRERAPRMVFFAEDVGGDYYGWDLGEPTAGSEYAIYARTPTYERVASSFEEFLLGYALGRDLARWSEAGEPGPDAKYEPGEDPRIPLEPM
ncbi:MAG TPA: SMI1/KNR4 family protein, partial [Acidimicrobiales bacterium]